MQDVDPQDDIVEIVNLARQLADRIGSTAEGSSTQDPAEPGQPPSTTDSGVPQPESSTSQAPASSELTDAAPAAVPPQRVTIMINGAEVDITDTGIDPAFLEALPDEMSRFSPGRLDPSSLSSPDPSGPLFPCGSPLSCSFLLCSISASSRNARMMSGSAPLNIFSALARPFSPASRGTIPYFLPSRGSWTWSLYRNNK
ncbi:hypothetical protein PCASD_22781 [Puccinia coronata f. sp. avenae]|uniref:Uncharacterized protein n=1 Tax=Puccinia coronata f. sp. avenae TaxID=200324 RepID=A0A2N5TJ54_9BASI|nr:hypothetical protein PCASD_22781 [Puccinia coronata f. sp. avenae]